MIVAFFNTILKFYDRGNKLFFYVLFNMPTTYAIIIYSRNKNIID